MIGLINEYNFDLTKFAVEAYDSDYQGGFYFDSYTSKANLIDGINNWNFTGASTVATFNLAGYSSPWNIAQSSGASKAGSG